MTGLDEIRRKSVFYARGTGLLLLVLVLLLLLERFGWLLAVPIGGPMSWQRLALACASAVPEVLHLAALWWLRRALLELGNGRLFAAVVTRALQRVGLLLFAGAALGVLLLPSVSAWLGQPPGYVIAYDVQQVVVAALGLSLGLVGRLLQHAAAIQSELDGIF